MHRLVHSSYIKEACAQCTLGVTATNELGPTTDFHAGSHSESTCVKANAERLFKHLKEDSFVITDKGYHIQQLLKRYLLYQAKPTEMSKGYGMTEGEGTRSRRLSQVRSVTERMVLQFKMFDMFDGPPVVQNEWFHLDMYKDFVSWLIILKGPLPDYLIPTSGEWP